jgi:L-aspartate oxidase
MSVQPYDFLVIGSGLAGLLYALEAAAHGRVAVVTKRGADDTNTRLAQGGIASVTDPGDDFERHTADTIAAGAGLCDRAVVAGVIGEAPEAIALLERYGVRFCREPDGEGYDLGREGGHSRRRILHAADATGRAIEETLLARVREHPAIDILEHCCAIDLITTSKIEHEPAEAGVTRVLGAYLLDARTGGIRHVAAARTLLATGGCGKVYRYTSNPDVATGDGLAMAYRAGARLANLEFVQFHPTCLFHPRETHFLISEAVRGEGAFLRSISGDVFMPAYHPDADLAPRDVVARAIDREMKRRGDRFVLLDLSRIGAERIPRRFPTIYQTCLTVGIDITREPIPVVPAAHYMCGGVLTDADGRTDLIDLYAAGEVACTGLHGANRLASNSLLESAVFARRAARAACRDLARERPEAQRRAAAIPPWDPGTASVAKESVLVNAHWELVRTLMWDFVGIVRNDHRLQLAGSYVRQFRRSVESYYWDFILDSDLIELRNIALLADLIIRAAAHRRESRGLHYNEDHPQRRDDRDARETLLDPITHRVAPSPRGAEPFASRENLWHSA